MTAFFALAIPVVLLVLVVRTLRARRVPRFGAVVVVLAAAVGVVDYVSAGVVAPGEPLAEGRLHVGESLELPATSSEVLIVNAAFDDKESGAARADYEFALKDAAAKDLGSISGQIEQHQERRRIGKRGNNVPVMITHNESQLALPEGAKAGATLTLTSAKGPIVQPVHVVLRPADLPLAAVFGGALALTLVMVVLMRGATRELAFPPLFLLAAAPVYASFLELGQHPPTTQAVFVIATGSSLTGLFIAAVLTLLPAFKKKTASMAT